MVLSLAVLDDDKALVSSNFALWKSGTSSKDVQRSFGYDPQNSYKCSHEIVIINILSNDILINLK